MLFPVYPALFRRECSLWCALTAGLGITEVIITFAGMYFAKSSTGVFFASFLCAVMLTSTAWRTLTTIKSGYQMVGIYPEAERVVLLDSSGKEVRTFSFSEIAGVHTVVLPVRMPGVAQVCTISRDKYICITAKEIGVQSKDQSFTCDVFKDSNCIVLLYNQHAYEMLQGMEVKDGSSHIGPEKG